jgi:hypothetical protein
LSKGENIPRKNPAAKSTDRYLFRAVHVGFLIQSLLCLLLAPGVPIRREEQLGEDRIASESGLHARRLARPRAIGVDEKEISDDGKTHEV